MVATKKYTYGLGRRKSATATVRLYKGKGEITINGKPALEYLSGNKTQLAEITDPLAIAGKQKEYEITVVAKGGGLAGQVDAIKLAISKALVAEMPDLRPVLKKAGLTSRDPREKERKKYGLRSARRKEQFSKR
jgi:small subunit ribosomal protein S9